MNENSLVRCLSYLDPNELIKIFIFKRNFLKIFFIDLIKKNNFIEKKNMIGLTISNFINFTPLPSSLKYNHVIECSNRNDNYNFLRKDKNIRINKILPGNIILPNYKNSSIPFTFGYTKNNKYILVNSNVYYYEVTLKKSHIHSKKDCISIGFGSIKNNFYNKHVGWSKSSVGVHSDDGKIFNDSSVGKNYNLNFGPGDTVGAGLIYVGKDEYIPFFTYNGKKFPNYKKIKIEDDITPQIGYDHSIGFKINFGNRNFRFNIDKVINRFNIIISSKNKFILNGFNIDKFKFKNLYYSHIKFPPKLNIKYKKLLKIPSDLKINVNNNQNNKEIKIIGTGINNFEMSPVSTTYINNHTANNKLYSEDNQINTINSFTSSIINNVVTHIDTMFNMDEGLNSSENIQNLANDEINQMLAEDQNYINSLSQAIDDVVQQNNYEEEIYEEEIYEDEIYEEEIYEDEIYEEEIYEEEVSEEEVYENEIYEGATE